MSKISYLAGTVCALSSILEFRRRVIAQTIWQLRVRGVKSSLRQVAEDGQWLKTTYCIRVFGTMR